MTGHGQKKNRKAEELIVALLSSDSIAAAAQAVKISQKTAIRWLADADFQRDYRAARRSVVEQSLAAIQAITGEAVQTLRRNLNCGRPSVEVAAALGLMDRATKGVELADFDDRLAALESRFTEQGKR